MTAELMPWSRFVGTVAAARQKLATVPASTTPFLPKEALGLPDGSGDAPGLLRDLVRNPTGSAASHVSDVERGRSLQRLERVERFGFALDGEIVHGGDDVARREVHTVPKSWGPEGDDEPAPEAAVVEARLDLDLLKEIPEAGVHEGDDFRALERS